ncbi:MAG: hypothetical protein M3N46_07945, partial [Actinomycetota bacterium]|nr:hypothetical protein [Actinomycetota bacterium]
VVPDVGNRGDAWIGTLAIMIVSGAWMGVLIAGGTMRMLQFIAWIFIYVFFGLAITVQLRSGQLSGTTPDLNPALDWPTVGVIVIGIVAFGTGIAVESVRSRGHAPASRPVAPRRAAVLVVVGLGFVVYTMSKVGLGVLFTSREAHDVVFAQVYPDPSTGAIIHALGIWPVVVGSQALVQWARSRHGADAGARRDRFRARATAIVAALVELTYVNPISSARYVFGTVWGSYLAPLNLFRTRVSTAMTMLGVVAAFILLFPIADAFRATTSNVTITRAGFFEEYEVNGDYDSFGQVSNAIRVVSEGGLTWGRQFLGVLLFFVPRTIWSSKPTDTGILLAERRGYSFSNLSAPLWAEGYINFGVVGVVVLFFFVGLLVQRLDAQGAAALRLGGAAALPASILPFYVFILMRGSLLQATGSLVVMIASMWFVRERDPRASWRTRRRRRS